MKMKKIKTYIRYTVGGMVAFCLVLAIVNTYQAANAGIDQTQVEDLALSLKLVSIDESDYPSIAEMTERVQRHRAAQAFTNVTVNLAVLMVFVAVLMTVGLSTFKLVKNKKKLLRFLVPAGGLVLVFICSRIFASSSQEGIVSAVPVTTSQLIKVSTLINATLILLVISFTALGTYRVRHILTK
jgi:hypothetical protein